MNDKTMQRTIKNSLQALALIFLLPVLLTGCGGGGGGGGGSDDPVVENIDPTGYYTGSVTTTNVDLKLIDAQFLVNGTRMMIVSDSKVVVYDGQLTITGSDFTSTMTIYHNGSKVGTTEVSGSFVEGSQIVSSTTLTGTGYGSGTMAATYDSTYNARPATTATLAATWRTYGLNEDNTFSYSFVIDTDGNLAQSGAVALNTFEECQLNGTILPIGTTHLYEVVITASACLDPNVDGSFTGLAATKDDVGQDDKLVFTITDGEFSTGDDYIIP